MIQNLFSAILMGYLCFAAALSKTPVTLKELSETLSYYRSIAKLTTQFRETKTLTDLNLKLRSEGRLTLLFPNRVIWEVQKPSPMTVQLDDKRVEITSGNSSHTKKETWSLDKAGEKGTRSIAMLVAWLKLDAQSLMAQYEVFSLSENKYQFYPKAKENSPFQSITMHLIPGGHLRSLKILELSNDTIELEFDMPHVEQRHERN